MHISIKLENATLEELAALARWFGGATAAMPTGRDEVSFVSGPIQAAAPMALVESAHKIREGASAKEATPGRSHAEPDVSTREGGGAREASTSQGPAPPRDQPQPRALATGPEIPATKAPEGVPTPAGGTRAAPAERVPGEDDAEVDDGDAVFFRCQTVKSVVRVLVERGVTRRALVEEKCRDLLAQGVPVFGAIPEGQLGDRVAASLVALGVPEET